ncbi:MAG: hypothetical protein KGO01_22105, partial [Burkholderiales bacterium]|nr:hypothetical protein [Burkholderiales bacterium]
ALEARLREAPAAQRAALLNQLGIAERRAGHFDAARRAYEGAIAADPQAAAPAVNLGILDDVYLGQPAQALALYRHAAELQPDARLGAWITELEHRKP